MLLSQEMYILWFEHCFAKDKEFCLIFGNILSSTSSSALSYPSTDETNHHCWWHDYHAWIVWPSRWALEISITKGTSHQRARQDMPYTMSSLTKERWPCPWPCCVCKRYSYCPGMLSISLHLGGAKHGMIRGKFIWLHPLSVCMQVIINWRRGCRLYMFNTNRMWRTELH